MVLGASSFLPIIGPRVRTRAHAHGAVPFALAGTGIAANGQPSYDEAVAETSDWAFDKGHELMPRFLG